MKVAVRGGHNSQAVGARALLTEEVVDRVVKDYLINFLKAAGCEVLDITPGPCDVNTDLAYGVDKTNAWGADLFLSIHFNKAYDNFDGALGTEAWIYGTGGKAEEYAKRMVYNVAGLGFKNRGVKVNSNLYELRKTTMPAVIYEVCFVEATEDARLYTEIGPERIAKRIAEGVVNQAITVKTASVAALPSAPLKSGTAVVYGNDIDKMACDYVQWAMGGEEKGVKLLDGNIPTDYSKYQRVICIGGIPPYFCKWTSYATDIVSGADRVETLKNGLKIAGRL